MLVTRANPVLATLKAKVPAAPRARWPPKTRPLVRVFKLDMSCRGVCEFPQTPFRSEFTRMDYPENSAHARNLILLAKLFCRY